MANFASTIVKTIEADYTNTMRKFFLSMVLLLSVGLSTYALDYAEARQRAWYLTDKMAYELNLSGEQVSVVYEINLDYFLRLNNRYDIEGNSWTFRHTDLQYVLLDWQYSQYSNTSYFYMPVVWQSSDWHYPVYTHYESEQYYFEPPTTYTHYRGTLTPRGTNDMGRYYDYVINHTQGLRELYDTHISQISKHPQARLKALTLPQELTIAHSATTRKVMKPTNERSANNTKLQREVPSNTIPALRPNHQAPTNINASRVGRSSSTRVTVNIGRRE